jgi:hypothetical protein
MGLQVFSQLGGTRDDPTDPDPPMFQLSLLPRDAAVRPLGSDLRSGSSQADLTPPLRGDREILSAQIHGLLGP